MLHEGGEEVGGVGQVLEGLCGHAGVLSCGRAAGFDAMEADVCVFGLAGIIADGFAHGLGIGGGIEDVVDDLKRHTEMPAKCLNCGEGGRWEVAAMQSHYTGGLQQVGGFVQVDKVEPVRTDHGVFGEGVDDLAADEVAAVCGAP